MVINWYCNSSPSDLCTQRLREHIQSPASVEYALFDFDLSLQMPLDTSHKKCRRPGHEAHKGKRSYIPADVFHGEPHYNPFAVTLRALATSICVSSRRVVSGHLHRGLWLTDA